MHDLRDELSAITKKIIAPELNYNDVRIATHALKDLFCRISEFDETALATQKHIQSGGGQAISTYTAALCITDMMRTRKFLSGIKEAIEEKLKQDPAKPVVVFYAGCGPFATLLTPLTTIFSPAQLQMILLEINSDSITCLQKIVKEFQLQEYIMAIEQADAVTYRIPEKFQPDILLSETMKPALEKEPQVNIVANLISQCKEETLLIPQSITVKACLIGNMAAEPMSIQPLQTLIDLDKTSARNIERHPAVESGIKISLKEKPDENFTRIALDTTVHVYGEHEIGLQESGITLIHPVFIIEEIQDYPSEIHFQYLLGVDPGFQYAINHRDIVTHRNTGYTS